MTADDETDTHLPNPPKKIKDRIVNYTPTLDTDEVIIGSGDIELTSKHPVKVVEYHLHHYAQTWSRDAYKDQSYDLTRLLEYCEYANIDDLSELSTSDLAGFKQWRKRDENIGLATLHGQLANIRVFIRSCQEMGIVDDGLADRIEMPDLDDSDIVSYVRIESEAAEQILDYYGQKEEVSRAFAEFALIWGVLLRLGEVRSLDLEDYNREEGYIELHHNKEEQTPLKNGESKVEGKGSEREVNLPDWLCDILNTYIDGTGDPNHDKRIDAVDEYGREPLFTSKQRRRVSKTTLRRDLYRITQPCRHGQACPHEMDPDECEARNDNNLLSKCPSNVSPHPVRRGGICDQLNRGVPKDTICERADVSRKVLNKHYDLRTKEEAREQRRDELKKHLDGYEDETDDQSEADRDASGVQREVPLVSDLTSVTDEYVATPANAPSQSRAVKGVAGYGAFVAVLGFNLALMGIGLNPLTWELIVNL